MLCNWPVLLYDPPYLMSQKIKKKRFARKRIYVEHLKMLSLGAYFVRKLEAARHRKDLWAVIGCLVTVTKLSLSSNCSGIVIMTRRILSSTHSAKLNVNLVNFFERPSKISSFT